MGTLHGTPLETRFLDRVEIHPGGCWIWTGGTNAEGSYGRFSVSHTRTVSAHRWAYERWVGPLLPGMTIDHVRERGCTEQPCVCPDHLEQITLHTNLMRGDTLAARNAAKTHCPRGHPYDGRGSKGERTCSVCNAAKQRAYMERKRSRR